MFDVIRNNRKFTQLFLVAITVPFALFGIDAYFQNSGASEAVATVGKRKITVVEFDNAVRQQTEVMRQRMGDAFDMAMIETPVFRSSVLDRLINERVLEEAIADGRFVVPDAYIQDTIKTTEQFQENGQFSMRLYQALISGQGMSPAAYEYKIRKDLEKRALMYPVAGSVKVPAALAANWVVLEEEERTVSAWVLDSKERATAVKLADDAAKKFYDANTKRFEQPEQVKLEYLVLSAEELAAKVTVSEEEAHKWYDEHKKERFTQPEERRASHILIQVAKDAKADDKAAAKKKAEDLLAKIKAQPATFAKLAKDVSDDKMSAEKGGDLGFFAADAMVPAFSDAAFKLKPKEVSGLVETEFGYHIIQLQEVRGGGVKSFDEAKTELMAELRRQGAAKRFSELGGQFGNMVYEQPDGLKPVADQLGLSLQTTDWVSADALPGVLSHPKVRAAVFAAESIKGKRNSEALDLGRDTSLSVRVVDHKAARLKPFDEVKAQAEEAAKFDEASKLAKTEGESALAKLKSGTAVDAKWGDAKPVKRSDSLPPEIRKAIFGSPVKQLPAYVGLATPTGYMVFRIEKLASPKIEANDPKIKQVADAYGSSLGQEDLRAYILSLRNRLGVKIDDAKVNAKSVQQ